VRVWDVTTHLEVARLKGLNKEVMTVAFAPHSNYLLAGLSDGTARLWNLSYETDSADTIARFVQARALANKAISSGSK
jgi:WD40 repeat protein